MSVPPAFCEWTSRSPTCLRDWISQTMRGNLSSRHSNGDVAAQLENVLKTIKAKKEKEKKGKKSYLFRTVMEDPLHPWCKRHQADLPAILNLPICNAWRNMLMWFLTSCGQTGPELEAKGRQAHLIVLHWPMLCQTWIMDDREPVGLTGNNSLPRGPFIVHNQPVKALELTPHFSPLKNRGSHRLCSCHG